MGLHHNPSIVMDGLTLCLDAANPRSYPGSGTTWTDLSGFGNNGTLTNGPTYSSANSGSIVFDGSDDQVNVSNGNLFFSGKNQVTVSVWFNLTSGNRPNLINVPVSNGAYFSIENGSSTSVTTLNTYFNNNNPTSFPFILNKYTHLTSVFNSGIVSTYKDGSLIDTKTNTQNTIGTFSSVNLVLGRWGWVYSNSIQGNIAQASIYSRALTAAEVQQNFNALRGRFGI